MEPNVVSGALFNVGRNSAQRHNLARTQAAAAAAAVTVDKNHIFHLNGILRIRA